MNERKRHPRNRVKSFQTILAVLLVCSLIFMIPGVGQQSNELPDTGQFPSLFTSARAEGDPNSSVTTFGGPSFNELGRAIAMDPDGNIYVAGTTDSPGFPTTKGAFDRSYNGGSQDIFVLKLSADGEKLRWSTFIGGNGGESIYDLILDVENNVLLVGYTSSANFPATENALDKEIGGELEGFLCKLSSDGTELLYSSFLGGAGSECVYGIAMDTEENIFVTGSTSSQDFPTTEGCFDSTLNGTDIFVTKVDPTATTVLFSTLVGGDEGDSPRAIMINPAGNACVAGITRSADFSTTEGCLNSSYDDQEYGANVVVFGLNQNGSQLEFSSFVRALGDLGSLEDAAMDNDGNLYLTGRTESADWPTTPGCYDDTLDGWRDAFVSKLNHNASELLYSTFIGGKSDEGAGAMALDSQGNVYITGFTSSSNFPTTSGAYDRTLAREKVGLFGSPHMGTDGDAFVCKLNPDGTELVYSTYVGGHMWDQGLGICLDRDNNACVTGISDSEDFPTNSDSYDPWYNGDEDMVVFKLDSRGKKLQFSSYVGDGDWRGGFLFISARQLKAASDALPYFSLVLFASLALAAVFLEPFRYRALGLGSPLYTRLTKDKLDAELAGDSPRAQINEFLADNPGSNLRTVREGAGFGHGTTVYHLSVLQRTGLIRSASRGREKRFWLKPVFPGKGEEGLTKAQQRIVSLLEENGELSRTELRELSDIPKATLRYNIKQLEEAGLLHEERRGLANFCVLRGE